MKTIKHKAKRPKTALSSRRTCIIYARVPDVWPPGEVSIEQQLWDCEQEARRERLKVLDTFTDVGDAQDLNRPGFTAMMKRCAGEPHVDCLLVDDYDRLVRPTADFALLLSYLQQHDVRLVCVRVLHDTDLPAQEERV